MTADPGSSNGVDPKTLAQWYPRLYHMAEANSWDSIRRHGLLSTTALLDLFEITGPERQLVESTHRPRSVPISHPRHGKAIIRDQIPMREADLEKCLTDLTPREWYETINGKVFFWATKERVLTLLNAEAYRERAHCVIIIDTAALLARHSKELTLCHMNSGCTRPRPWPRGRSTFSALPEYPFEFRRARYGQKGAIAEFAIPYGVQNIVEMTISVKLMRRRDVLRTLFER